MVHWFLAPPIRRAATESTNKRGQYALFSPLPAHLVAVLQGFPFRKFDFVHKSGLWSLSLARARQSSLHSKSRHRGCKTASVALLKYHPSRTDYNFYLKTLYISKSWSSKKNVNLFDKRLIWRTHPTNLCKTTLSKISTKQWESKGYFLCTDPVNFTFVWSTPGIEQWFLQCHLMIHRFLAHQ